MNAERGLQNTCPSTEFQGVYPCKDQAWKLLLCVCFNGQSPDFQMLAIIFLQRLCVFCELHLAYKPTAYKPITAHNNFILGANPLCTIIYNKEYNCQVHFNSHFWLI